MRIFLLSLILTLILSACNPGSPAASETPIPTLARVLTGTGTPRPPTATPTQQPSGTPQPSATINVNEAVTTFNASVAETRTAQPAIPTWTPGPTTDPARIGAGTPVALNQCRRDVQGLLALHQIADQSFDYSDLSNTSGKPGPFDAASTFQVLDHLSMRPGYQLDYVYMADGLGGRPVLYARGVNQAPYPTYEDFKKAAGNELNTYNYLDYVQSDDSSAGYFQYIVMATMGNQYYLWWHALYNDFQILCDRADLDQIQQQLADFGAEMQLPAEVLQQADKVDFTPTVHLTDDSAVVRVVGFTKWGGLIEQYFTLSRQSPHHLLDSGYQVLAEWDCGILF